LKKLHILCNLHMLTIYLSIEGDTLLWKKY
jgi:hypothetical protein